MNNVFDTDTSCTRTQGAQGTSCTPVHLIQKLIKG